MHKTFDLEIKEIMVTEKGHTLTAQINAVMIARPLKTESLEDKKHNIFFRQ